MNAGVMRAIRLSKRYGRGEQACLALDGVSVEVDAGEMLLVTGPSGCGKSTLLSLLGLLEAPDGGTIHWDDEDLTHASDARRAQHRAQHFGFVFQNFNLIPTATVQENVALALEIAGQPRPQRMERAAEELRRVGLGDQLRKYPEQLSGGQQQRAAIARAMVKQPRVLLADEPTGNLDSRNGDAVMELFLAAASAGTSIVMVTHDARFSKLATRELHLHDGRLVA